MIDERLEHELQEHYEFDCYNQLLDMLLSESDIDKDGSPVIDWIYEDYQLQEDKENRLINLEFDSLVYSGD